MEGFFYCLKRYLLMPNSIGMARVLLNYVWHPFMESYCPNLFPHSNCLILNGKFKLIHFI